VTTATAGPKIKHMGVVSVEQNYENAGQAG
jgi:hypothetical protein